MTEEYKTQFALRLALLRSQRGMSARDMSFSLGKSASYINKIENGYALPSMEQFFEICDCLDISPLDFFNDRLISPNKTKELVSEFEKLNMNQADHVLQIIRDILQR